jgi:hypothetical protein
MGRALMIPGMVGKNIARWLKGEDGGLPSTVAKYGATKEEIFVAYEELKDKYGNEVDNLPLGAIGIYSAGEKLRVGLQQLMAGARKWKVDLISRNDLACLTEEATRVTSIPYIMNAYRDEALEIIDSGTWTSSISQAAAAG